MLPSTNKGTRLSLGRPTDLDRRVDKRATTVMSYHIGEQMISQLGLSLTGKRSDHEAKAKSVLRRSPGELAIQRSRSEHVGEAVVGSNLMSETSKIEEAAMLETLTQNDADEEVKKGASWMSDKVSLYLTVSTTMKHICNSASPAFCESWRSRGRVHFPRNLPASDDVRQREIFFSRRRWLLPCLLSI